MPSLFPCILENSSVCFFVSGDGGGASSYAAQVGLELLILLQALSTSPVPGF